MSPCKDSQEKKYAEETIAAVKKCIEKELSHLKIRRGNILDERRYFNDYFYELKDDEKKDLLENELLDTNAYVYSLQLLTRLGKQLKEPYFAGFTFSESDGGAEEAPENNAEQYYLSIHTLRDPETGAIITTDWRAPSHLYITNRNRARHHLPLLPVKYRVSFCKNGGMFLKTASF